MSSPDDELEAPEGEEVNVEELLQERLPPVPVPPPRVFLTHVDSYIGRHLSKLLSEAFYNPPRETNDATASEYDPDANATHEDSENARSQVAAPQKLEVIGTLEKPDGQRPEWVTEVVKAGDRDGLRAALATCNVIIYDIGTNVEEAAWLCDDLAEASDTWDEPKTLVCLTTVMTWARTKKMEEEGASAAGAEGENNLVEDDYKRRKPHPNFKAHLEVEKVAMKWGNKKKNLRAYIIARGLLYGAGEEIFHFLFKAAWHGVPKQLPCIGRGRNVLPTIHVKDFANVVAQVVCTLPQTKYILAIDDSVHTSLEITQCVSTALGSGQVKKLKKDDALLIRELTQTDIDMLQVDLSLEPNAVKDMEFQWTSETGLVENIQSVIREYKETRGLTPIRIFIQGPPGAGKSFYAARIAKEYKIHHIKTEQVIEEYLIQLTKQEGGEELLEEINVAREENGGRITDDHMAMIFRDKLLSMPCQNQGFILDGFPKTMEQAALLFKESEEQETESRAETERHVDDRIFPDFVVVLEADDEFLKARIMNQSESAVAGTHNNEEGLLRRLAQYRATNTPESAVWDFFDQRDVLPLAVPIDANSQMNRVMSEVKRYVGKPHNYGPTQAELEEKARIKAEAQARAAAEAERQQREQEEHERELREQRDREWKVRLGEIRKQESVVLETKSTPLRQYLMEHVMPTLTAGLIEVCSVRPDDPIDYLAEYLFKANPTESE